MDGDINESAFGGPYQRFVPANLFTIAGIEQPWPTKLARWRRLLVTAWLLCSNGDGPQEATVDDMRRARDVWDTHVAGLDRAAVVTVTTVLAQLKELGFVKSFDAVEGGYAVRIVKEVA